MLTLTTCSCICTLRRHDIHRLKYCITDVGQWMSANRLKLNTEKTELLWAGSRHSQSSVTVSRPARGRFRHGTRRHPSACVCLKWQSCRIWVCSVVCLTCPQHLFYWLRQLRRVRQSLDSDSAATLVHPFVTSRIDQCNAVLAGATKSVTDSLQRVMNDATRVVSDTR